jgi:hypothetical protein
MLIQSVALRLLESAESGAWWMITVPEGTEHAVASQLREEIATQGGAVHLWPEEAPGSGITLYACTPSVAQGLSSQLDTYRSSMAKQGAVVLIVAESTAGELLHGSPHVASFIAGRVAATNADDDDAPPEYVARRLASFREAYGMTDVQAREAFESGHFADDIHFLEWMVLLGEGSKESTS